MRDRSGLPPVGGYVLAGGRSSRMGQDKALLDLAGHPLIEYATTKLRRLCADVHILSSEPALAEYGPMVRDVHPGCGPMGGIEAALLHSPFEWNLILPVDVPFLTTAYLEDWMWSTLRPRNRLARMLTYWKPEPREEIRVCMLTVDGAPQPALLILHKEMGPYLTRALEAGEYKLLPVLKGAAEEIAQRRGIRRSRVFINMQWDDPYPLTVKKLTDLRVSVAEAQRGDPRQMFANLNTVGDVVEARKHADVLES